ncbi:MAG: hypothetical protein R6U58_01090 [Bacteroidales bacterium]
MINKSASSLSRMEHRSAFWVLNHERIVKSDGNKYNHREDYYGFIPLQPYSNKEYIIRDIMPGEIDSLSDHYDLAWFADTHGITYGEWYDDSGDDTFSRLLYGGLSHNDYLFIKHMLNDEKMVIAEFNFFAAPTSDSIRSKVEKMTGVFWSGWTGMYYDNLNYTENDELPDWIVDLYKEQNHGDWPFTKPGIVLVNHNDKVVILESETHIDIHVPLITTNHDLASKYGISAVVHYPYRFDISYAADTTNVISYFHLNANTNGLRVLKNHNIPARFPAVTINTDKGYFYYLAGNYSGYDINMLTSSLSGSMSLDFLLHSDRIGSKGEFFREYYYPFISKIINDYYKSLSER